jgi:nicotinamide-nucleotide adenylyltransferase
MRSLVLGRFQPLHLGHMQMVEYVAERSSFLTIGLGSCNSPSTSENPFTAEEREQMIKESLRLPISFDIKRIPDFGDNKAWAKWVEANISFDVFWTNSQNEREIFLDEGRKVQEIPFFDRETYSASEVRKRILEDGDWSTLLPQGTVKVLGTIDGIYRIKNLSGRNNGVYISV